MYMYAASTKCTTVSTSSYNADTPQTKGGDSTRLYAWVQVFIPDFRPHLLSGAHTRHV